MGSCASVNGVQLRNDQVVKKVKVSNLLLKQREDQRRLRRTGNGILRPMIGEERNTDIELETYAKQIQLMPRTQRNVTAFFGTLTFADSSKIFQPMLKNMVLDNQESFPKWLYLDEQFRNDQMHDFLSKCQETAKLQSQDEEQDNPDMNNNNYNNNTRNPTLSHIRERQNNRNNDSEDEDEDDEDQEQHQSSGQKSKQQSSQMLTSISRLPPSGGKESQHSKRNTQLRLRSNNNNNNYDSKEQIESDEDDESKGLISKGVTKNRQNSKQPTSQPMLPVPIAQYGLKLDQRRGSAAGNSPSRNNNNNNNNMNERKGFTKARSIYEEKSPLSKRSALEDDDDGGENSHSDEGDDDQRKDMRKFQELSGLKSSMNQNNFLNASSRKHLSAAAAGGEGADGVGSESEVGNNGTNTNKQMNSSRSQIPSLNVIKSESTRRQTKHRTSNGSNHYVIKEFVIVRNNWIHTAICCAAIKTPTNLLEFKRRFFYEFDKMSAFLSQLLALKRMNFPNLLTFSYIQIGEASYSGDLQQVRKRMEQEEAMMLQSQNSPSSNTLGIKDMQPGANMRKSKRGNTLQVHQNNLFRSGSSTANGAGGSSNTNNNNPGAGAFPGTIQESLRDMNASEFDDEEDSRLIMYIDRIFPECGKSLEEFMYNVGTNPVEDMLRICTQGFKVFYSLANTLCKMHRAGFSYRVLRPSMVRIVQQSSREMNVFLDSPDFIWDAVENVYLTKYVRSETDFMNYDCKCLSALMIYFFLTIQETRMNILQKNASNSNVYSMNRIGGNAAAGTGNNGASINSQQQNGGGDMQHLKPNYVGIASSVTSLKLIGVAQPHAMSFAELVTIEDAVELESIVSRLKLPQIVIETIKELIVPELKSQKPIEEFAVRLLGVLEKGPQTAFKHDSLSAYLSFHGQRTLKNENMHVYFRRKNQVHFYEFESKTFKVIKLMRKKSKFPVRTHMTFSHYDNCFYFFAAQNSNKVVKFPLNTNSKQRHVINQKSEVIFFKSIKNIPMEDPQILTVIPDQFSFSLYVFNSKSSTDHQTNDVFYNSFIVNVEYKQNEQNKDDWKENIQIYEGPRNYLWRRRSFHFFDPHNKFIYCILDSVNIFERGIRFSYFDTSLDKGDFKDGNLRFACSTEEVFDQFCSLNMHIDSMEFCVEVQHGVFLLQASKNIYVLDFNYKCFYSFSTLKQLKEFESNRKKHPIRHAYAYEILNQPFEVKLNTALNLGKNVVFQEGLLHMLGRKEIETVICSYELLPTQGVMVLKKCFSLHSFEDILQKIPRPLLEIWNFQEYKRVIIERATNPFVYIDRSKQFIANNALMNGGETLTNTMHNPATIANSQTLGNSMTVRNVPTIKVSGTNAGGDQQQQYHNGQTIFNTSTLKPSVTVLPAPPGMTNADSNKQKFKTAATKGQDSETDPSTNANDQSRAISQLSKQDEQKLQIFTTKINIFNGSPSNLTGTTEGLDEITGYHDNQFKLLSIFQQNKDYTLYRIMHHANPCNLRKAAINSIAQYEQYIQLLEMNAQSKYLIQIKQCFLTQDDDTGQLNINLIEDDCEWSLLDELRRRKVDQNFFRAPEIGQLLKAIFKAVLALQSIELKHGNILPNLVYFTSKGHIRIAGWYLDNHETFENDFFDACTLIFQVATLEVDTPPTLNEAGEEEPFRLTLQVLQAKQEGLKAYPGLYSFLHNNLLILQDGENLDLEKTEEDVRDVYQSLQVSTLKLNREKLSSVNRYIFWVGYGGNTIISSHYSELSFCKNNVVYHNNLPYKFSKYNMFTFDAENIMYMSGATKEDFKSPTQQFYQIDFNFVHNSSIKLRQLKDIPNSILQPSLMYCNEYVYCVGGYQIKFDGSKSISKKAYRYSIKTEDWEQLSDMPVGVVSGTLLTGKENKVLYLFGGVSEEVDLRGRELNYIVYDIDFDEWNLKIDLSMKSPFVNNRYVKPLIDHIGNDIFVSMQRTPDAIYIQFFELKRGGLNIKFKIDDEKDELIKEQNAEIDVFNEISYRDYFKTYQDDLSLIFVNDTVYILDEFSNALLVINFANFNNIKYERTPCGLITSIQKSSQLDRNFSYDHDTSIDSFFFNGY